MWESPRFAMTLEGPTLKGAVAPSVAICQPSCQESWSCMCEPPWLGAMCHCFWVRDSRASYVDFLCVSATCVLSFWRSTLPLTWARFFLTLLDTKKADQV